MEEIITFTAPPPPRKVKSGFTLAEVLITLAIIGVVAALTIPTVVRNYQKSQTIAQLKKLYSTFNQAYNTSQAQNGMYATWDHINNTSDITPLFSTYWEPYLKISKFCDAPAPCGYKSATPWNMSNGNASTVYAFSVYNRKAFILQDGTFVLFRTEMGSDGNMIMDITTDLNAAKAPNTYGKDVFRFVRTEKGILPFYYERGMSGINNECSKKSVGQGCAAKIMRDGWQIKDDYPW